MIQIFAGSTSHLHFLGFNVWLSAYFVLGLGFVRVVCMAACSLLLRWGVCLGCVNFVEVLLRARFALWLFSGVLVVSCLVPGLSAAGVVGQSVDSLAMSGGGAAGGGGVGSGAGGVSFEQRAVSRAQALGVRVLVPGLTTQHRVAYASPDGTIRQSLSSVPERVKTKNGHWRNIDTRLVRKNNWLKPKVPGSWVGFGAGRLAELRFPSDVVEREGIRAYEVDPVKAEQGPRLSLAAGKSSLGIVRGASVTHRKFARGVKLTTRAMVRGFGVNIRLSRNSVKNRQMSVTLPLLARGIRLRNNSERNTLQIVRSGKTVGWWYVGLASAGKLRAISGEPRFQQPARIRMVNHGKAVRITVPRSVWAKSSAPVEVGSEVTEVTKGATYGQATYPTTVLHDDETFKTGAHDGSSTLALAYVEFPFSLPSNTVIASAHLRLWNWWSGACGSGAMNVNMVTESWKASTLTWHNRPASSHVASGGREYVNDGKGGNENQHCAGGWLPNSTGIDVLDVVNAWHSGKPNYGFALAATNSERPGYKQFRGQGKGSQAPHLDVVYYPSPGATSVPVLSPVTSDGTVTSSTPTIKVQTPSYSAGALQANLTVLDSGGHQVWSTGWQNTSSNSTFQGTMSKQWDGHYKVTSQVRAGGVAYSSVTSKNFVIDADSTITVNPFSPKPHIGTTSPVYVTTTRPDILFTVGGDAGVTYSGKIVFTNISEGKTIHEVAIPSLQRGPVTIAVPAGVLEEPDLYMWQIILHPVGSTNEHRDGGLSFYVDVLECRSLADRAVVPKRACVQNKGAK